jgi:uncharacterized membrane protein YbhN (UPF0104 family)
MHLASVAQRIRSNKLIRVVGGLFLALFLGWLIARGTNWGELSDLLYHFPLGHSLLALGVFLVGIVVRTWRWYILLFEERVSFGRLFIVQNAGIGLNNVSPVRLLSEPTQLLLLTQRGHMSAGYALATLATEHLVDILVTTLLLTLGVLFIPQLQGYSIQLVGAALLAAVSLLVFLVIVRGMESLPFFGKVPVLGGAINSIHRLLNHPLRLFLSFIGTIVHWGLVGVSGWVIAKGLGIDVGVAVVVVLFMGSVFFVSAIPSLPGGAITFEAAVVYTLSLFAVGNEQALAFALLMHLILFAPSTIIALVVLPREGIRVFSMARWILGYGLGLASPKSNRESGPSS